MSRKCISESSGTRASFSTVLLALLLVSCAGVRQEPRYGRVDLGTGTFESRYKLTGRPVVKMEDGYSRINVITEKPSEAASEIFAHRTKLPRLDASATYDFEVLEDEYGAGRKERTLLNISDRSGRKIYDASRCPLHDAPMDRRMEEQEDLPNFPSIWTARKRFPNDGVAYLACGSGYSHIQWVCPKCLEISERWRKRHRDR